ncbi:MAG: hypothetical protein RSB34_01425 [Muribaculaceae bacterium]
MKRLKYISIIVLGILLFASCSKDNQMGDENVPKDAVLINLNLPGGVPSRADVHTDNEDKTEYESRVLNATVLLYDHTSQELIQKFVTGEDGVRWNNSETCVIISRNKISDYSLSYDVVVIANMPEAAALEGTIDIGDTRSALNDIYSRSSAPIVLDSTHALMMMGSFENKSFNDNKIVNVNLLHQAVKIRVNVQLTPNFAAIAGNSFKTSTLPSRITLFNVPSISWITNTEGELFQHHIDLTHKKGYALLDCAPMTMVRTSNTNEWNTTIYAYENIVNKALGELTLKNLSTSFALQIPYVEGGKEVTDNYYKIMIEDPTPSEANNNKYKTVRNHLYDVKVKVNGYGDIIPSIDGTEIKIDVLPWNSVNSDVNTDANEIFEISNTACQIVGDHDDNTVIAQATLSQAGAVGQIKVEAIEGKEFFTVNSPINIVNGVPADITINVKSTFASGKVRVSMGTKSKEITISKEFDKAKMEVAACNKAVSSATWCTLSPNATYSQAEQTQTLEGAGAKWLHIDKTTLGGNATRTASVMLTKADNSVVRMTVVQRPYVTTTVASTVAKWATGNIEIGHRPDGTPCYVIGASTDYGLLFQFMTAAGLARGAEGSPWNNAVNIYNPAGTGSTASIGSVTHVSNWTGVLPNRTQDPCSYIASPDGIRWRTPTAVELKMLVTPGIYGGNGSTAGQSWSGTSVEQQGFHTANGKLFFSCPGRRETGVTGGRINLSDKSKGDQQVSNRSSTTGSTLAVMPYRAPGSFPDGHPGDRQVFESHQDDYAMPVRCVRTN